VSGNSTSCGGTVYSSGFVQVSNSTVTNNSSGGGALYGNSGVGLFYATVVDNTTTGNRAAFQSATQALLNAANVNSPNTISSFGSVVALHHGGPNCAAGGFSSNGYNWSDDASCGFTAGTDTQNGGDPGLGALGDNGGPTFTRFPGPGSPLIDVIPTNVCGGPASPFVNPFVFFVSTDQRGVSRPQGPACDIGAVEVDSAGAGSAPVVTVTASPASAVEGGADGGFVFSRTGDKTSALPISFSTGGSATSGTDYTALGSVVIPAGQASVAIPVHALAGSPDDNGENVSVQLAVNNQYSIGSPNSATVNIRESGFCDKAPQAPYTDRNLFDVHASAIDCITAYGMAEGFTDGTYGPTVPVSRAQMASFIARLLVKAGVTLPSNPPDAFPGDNGGVHELAINQLAALGGILDDTTGQSPPNFNVSDPMRRDNMAQLLFNSYKVIVGAALPAGPDAFTDDTGNPNEAAIDALAQAGVVQGTGGGLYDPSGSVSRGQMASFFVRLMQLLVDTGKLAPLP
jgi:hypothetical protein